MHCPIDIREEAGVRSLHFGSDWVQGAMRIARPWSLELEYTREMMASLLLREGGGVAAGNPSAHPSRMLRDDSRFPRKVLLIGLGAASLLKFLYRHYPLAKLTVVEIEPDVVAAARQFFKLPEDPERIRIVVGDGAEYMLKSNKSWDLILVDGFDSNARAGGLDTLTFYLAAQSRLSGNGILSVNLLSRRRGFKDSLERIRTAFEGRALAFPSCDSGNAIAFAAAGEPVRIPLGGLREQATTLKRATGLNLLPALVRLEQSKTCTGGVLVL
jgi:spermidine synthase